MASVVAAARMRHHAVLRLHVVVGAALVLALVSMSRIFGQLWYYLMIWSWAITGLLVVAVVWTAAAAIGPRLQQETRARVPRIAAAALVALTAVSSLLFAIDAGEAEVPAPTLSATLGAVVPATADALDAGVGAATGRDGRYLVVWSDTLYIGSQGFGLVSELERRGFDVGVPYSYRAPVTRHRVMDEGSATAVVALVNGIHVAEWRAKAGAVEVVVVDPRTPAEREEYERLRAEVIEGLRQAGLDDLVLHVDDNLFAAAIDPRVDRAIQDRMGRMLDLGLPTAVFVAPPGTSV
jgi:hypothetical protein